MRAARLRLLVPPPTRVLLGEGQALVRAGLRVLLESDPGISVVAEAATGEDAAALSESLEPEVVLLDVAIGGLDCVATAERIRDGGPAVLLLVESDADDRILAALRAGASGTVLRDAEPGELVGAVQRAARGDVLLTPALTRRLIAQLGNLPERAAPTPEELDELTVREREVMALAARGLTNAEIAEQLTVSPATAKTHISRAMVKLQAHDRAQLVALAYESGLVLARS
jgi:DNA-binding NarL/FixJ family response regulator